MGLNKLVCQQVLSRASAYTLLFCYCVQLLQDNSLSGVVLCCKEERTGKLDRRTSAKPSSLTQETAIGHGHVHVPTQPNIVIM